MYGKLVVKREYVIKKWIAYLLLNIYLILLLTHPSKLIMLDGLVFGVMAMYPVWTDRKWVRWQTVLLGLAGLFKKYCGKKEFAT